MSLYLQSNLDKFIKGADAPLKQDLEIRVDKEWVKRLLLEFDLFWDDRRLQDDDPELEYFLEMSEVWNGKNN